MSKSDKDTVREEALLTRYERKAFTAGFQRIAGVDEAGRGPLAGPVVAAAVSMEPNYLLERASADLSGLTDSKKLTEPQRESFFYMLTQTPEIRFGIGESSVEEIDELNILKATHLAMKRAVSFLLPQVDHALVDGRPVPGLPCSSTAIVRGDSLSLLIAAASVVAKVTRDRMMVRLDEAYPQYRFAKHKGYGTKVHIQALNDHGPSPCHRKSFAPVRGLSAEEHVAT